MTAVAKAIKRGRVGLKDPKRPIGSFLFLLTDRRWKDGTVKGSRGDGIWKRTSFDPCRYDRIYGKT